MQYYTVTWSVPKGGKLVHSQMTSTGTEEWRGDLHGMDVIYAHSIAEAEAVIKAARPATDKVQAVLLVPEFTVVKKEWRSLRPAGHETVAWCLGDYYISHDLSVHYQGRLLDIESVGHLDAAMRAAEQHAKENGHAL